MACVTMTVMEAGAIDIWYVNLSGTVGPQSGTCSWVKEIPNGLRPRRAITGAVTRPNPTIVTR